MSKPLSFIARIPGTAQTSGRSAGQADPVKAEATPPVPAGAVDVAAGSSSADPKAPVEIGGPQGPDPTRFGDWEIGGRCIDF